MISVKREFDMEEIPDYLWSSVQFGFIYMVQILNNSYVKVIYIVKILQYYRGCWQMVLFEQLLATVGRKNYKVGKKTEKGA